jgi:Mor family transcriptional regulator
MAFAVPDGLRHLRNFAKKRRKVDILRAISEFISKKKPDEILSSGVQNDFSEVTEIFKQVYEADNLKQREKLLERAAKSL